MFATIDEERGWKTEREKGSEEKCDCLLETVTMEHRKSFSLC